jgi:hypothetical protein
MNLKEFSYIYKVFPFKKSSDKLNGSTLIEFSSFAAILKKLTYTYRYKFSILIFHSSYIIASYIRSLYSNQNYVIMLTEKNAYISS